MPRAPPTSSTSRPTASWNWAPTSKSNRLPGPGRGLMSGEIAAARAHPAIVASVIVASVAVTACALVAIAWMVGWIPAQPSLATPTAIAIPGSQVAGSAPEVALAPGETLVAPPEPPARASAPGPATPRYARQPEGFPAPASVPPAAAPSPSPLQLAPAPALTPKPRPATTAYPRAAPPPPATS